MKRNVGRLIAILTLLILLNACTPANQPTVAAVPTATIKTIVDIGLLPGRPCGPPCMLGIQPGVTDYDKVMNILTTNHDVTCKEYHDGEGQGIQCENSVVISFDTDKKFVTSLGYTPTAAITVQNVMDTLGDPQNIDVVTGSIPNTFSKMRLFYPKDRISILLDEQDGESYTISPENKVRTVTYVGEKSYESLTQMAQQWSGFGKYTKQ